MCTTMNGYLLSYYLLINLLSDRSYYELHLLQSIVFYRLLSKRIKEHFKEINLSFNTILSSQVNV